MLTKNSPLKLEVKDVSDDGTITGYGSVFGNVDNHKDIVEKGAFEESLARHSQAGTMPKMLWAHDTRALPIGSWEEAKEDNHGLFLKGRLAISDDPMAARVHSHLKAKRLDGLSIGYSIQVEEWDRDKNINLLKEVDLWEVSVVTFPANTLATVTDVKASIQSIRDLEALLRDERALTRKEAAAIASRFAFKDTGQRDARPGPESAMSAAERLLEILHR